MTKFMRSIWLIEARIKRSIDVKAIWLFFC